MVSHHLQLVREEPCPAADKRACWHSPNSWHPEAGAKPCSFCELDAQNTCN
jgi:hypothetical protein